LNNKKAVIIPSFRTREELSAQVCEVEGTVSDGWNVIPTCQPGSAAHNRNYGLKQVEEGSTVIMVDDDISGFKPGWTEKMIELLQDPSIVMVSARLINRDGTPAPMMFMGTPVGNCCQVPRCPTAAIAFRHEGIMFDENFIGSGYEDDDFCAKIAEKHPKGMVFIHNEVRLVHANEQKNQGGEYMEKNKAYFESIWETVGNRRVRRAK